uniref:Succinate dehydrogenase subunit 4 n=1 Tax=Vertebrata lanosa TaxID=1261582 RepID=A0A1J0F7J8_9FLOR|nr:succinate dehydrogenase subunit 4 [Vertebrata lanosa]APC24956.1 succinate dehydrogenase subunit 4 [Vertebrata lanosa]
MYYSFMRYFTSIFLLISFIVDLEIVLLFLSFFQLHLFLGINSILKDYIHQNEIKILLIFLNRLVLIFFFSIILEIIF